MIQAEEAIRVARGLIGTAYSELDCINLVKKVIRTAPANARAANGREAPNMGVSSSAQGADFGCGYSRTGDTCR